MPNATDTTVPASANPVGVKVSGPITNIAFPSLIHSICADHDTGVLTLEDGELKKSVYVRDGKLVFARSNDPDDRLGEILLRQGAISVRGLEESSKEMENTGVRLGGVLVKGGLVTPKELIEAVRDQVREVIHSMFLWTRGNYHFVMGGLPTEEVITLRVNTGNLIRTGIRRIQSWSRIRAAVGGLDTRYRYVPEFDKQLEELELSREEEILVQLLSEPSTLGDVCDMLLGNSFETCRMVWAFHVMGALERVRGSE